MNEDNRKRVYDLKEQTGYIDSYEDFNKAFDASEDNRKRVYDVLKEQTGYIDSYEDFNKGMSAPGIPVPKQQAGHNSSAGQAVDDMPVSLGQMKTSSELGGNLGEKTSSDESRGLFANYVKEQLANIDKELNTPRESLPMPAGTAFIPSTAVAAAQRYGNAQARERQDRYTALVAARNFLDEAGKIVEEAGNKGKTNFVAGALRGVRDKAFDPDTWMMGISETSYYSLLRQAAEKEERGEQLSSEEQQLLDAAAVNMAANAYYASDLGRGYKAGSMGGESIPFMLQFALNPVSATGKGIARTILRHGMKRFGLNTTKRTVSGTAARAAARIAGDAAAAAGLTATTGIGNVAADAGQRMTGNVRFREDEDGGIRYDGREGAVGTGEAIARAFTSNFFENQSEMVGNYFAPAMRAVSALVRKLPGVKQLSASKAGEIYRGIKNNPTYKEFTDRTQWHGAIGEYAEEVYNNLASVAIGDMTPEELVDLDNNIDTFLGVFLMSAMFGGIGAAGFARDRYTLNRAIGRFESTLSPDEIERWGEVKRVAQNGDVEGVREFVKYTMRDNELTAQEKKDEIEYIFNVMRRAAMENVAAEQTEETVRAETDDIISNSDTQTNTYTECNRIMTNDVGEQVEVPGHIVGYMGGHPLWKPAGAGPEVKAIPLREGEYNPESIKSMPVQEVVDETAAAIREDAAGQAQRENTYSPDIVPYNQLESGKSSFYDKDGNLYEVGFRDTDTKNFMMLVTSPDGTQIASRPFSEEEYLSICQARIDAQEAAQPEYSLNTEITLRDEAGNAVRGTITAEKNDDGLYEVQTESPINGRRVNLFTADELRALSYGQPGQTSGNIPQENIQNTEYKGYVDNGMVDDDTVSRIADKIARGEQLTQEEESMRRGASQRVEDALRQRQRAEQPRQSATERIPKDEQGQPVYEQADPDTAWDAIVEQTGGDEAMAQSVADSMVADKEAELKKAEKARPKGGTTVAEKIAAERERRNAVEQAKANLAHWQRIAQTSQTRRQDAALEQSRQAKEAARLRREQEERERAEREEAGRIEREALNGVPDMVDDTPKDARARGYRRVNGHKVERQEPLQAVQGKAVGVRFSDDTIPSGHVAVIYASRLQPSHLGGQRNPYHFIDEAQPKERNDEASVLSAGRIAGNIRPEEITSSVTAYTGAPTVNARGEVIQGNNRSTALKEMWAGRPEQAAKYKQYLVEHAADFGLAPEDVEAMQQPVLVNMLDVTDEDAISLGQFVAQDNESGGTERIKPKNIVQKMGGDIKGFAARLLASPDEETTFAGLVDRNGRDVLKWMQQKGYVTPTQYKSAFDSKGNLTAEAVNDMKGIMYRSIFQNGNTRLEEMFNTLPGKSQKAILATAYRDYDSPGMESMNRELQSSIQAYHALSQYEPFRDAKNYKEARMAAESWKRQFAFGDVTGEGYLPSERYSNFALLLATMYKGQTQAFMQGMFNDIYDLVQGTQEATLFEEPDNTPRTLVEAINEAINARGNELLLNEKFEYDGQRRSDVLAGGSEAGQQGGQGSTGRAQAGERTEGGTQTADSGRGTVPSDAERGGQGDLRHPSRRQQDNLSQEAVSEKVKLSDEIDENGRPFVISENGTTIFGEIREESGLTPAPIKLSEGYQDEDGKGYGLIHIEANHGDQIRKAGFKSVEDFVYYVAENYDEDNIRVGKRRSNGSPTFLLQITDTHDNTLFVEMSKDGSYWNVNSAGIFRKGYSNKKETVAKTEPQQPNNAVSTGSSLSENEEGGITSSEPNGEPTVSDSEDSEKKLSSNEPSEKIASAEENQSAVPARQEGESLLDYAGRVAKVREIEDALREVTASPTEAQKEAGNYRKGHVSLDGYDITIESPKGSVRSGKDANGQQWSVTMNNDYGYIRGTEGVDGDHIDVFLSDDPTQGDVYVIDQVNPDTGEFDEHKVMYGFKSALAAKRAYLANYSPDWKGLGVITKVSKEEFKKWVGSSHRKTKPFAEYKSVNKDDESGSPDRPLSLADMREVEAPRHNWKYDVSVDNKTGRTRITRSEVTDGVPVDDANFELTAGSPQEMLGILGNPQNVMEDVLDAVRTDLENAVKTRSMDTAQPRQVDIGGLANDLRKNGQARLSDHFVIGRPGLTQEMRPRQDAATQQPEENSDGYGANNKLVSRERYEELKRRMRRKLGGQLNVGIDPEILAIGTEMAAYHIEAGARKFADYARHMIDDLGDKIRPYLKAFYNGARDLPEVQEAGLADEMTPYDEVRTFDAANFDKPATNVLDTAQMVVQEQEANKQADSAKNALTAQRNEKDRRKRERNRKKEVNDADELKIEDLFSRQEEFVTESQEDKSVNTATIDVENAEINRIFANAVKTDMLSALDRGTKPYRSILDLRKRAAGLGMEVDNDGRTDILLQELVEDGLVRAAREVVNKHGRDSSESYDLICKLYDMQPTIAARSSNRIKMQQYSTPLPMAWNVARFAMTGKKDGKVLEPTAGNGMLVFAIPAGQVHANELDGTRLANLREQGFAQVTQQDATEPFEGGKQYDVVIANPPFGKREAVDYDGKLISGLDPQITLNALASMKDDGKAAIIIGGNMEYAKNGAINNMKPFFTYLYDHYNVKGVVDMDGKLYAKQGTTYPTRMILIDGRRSDEERAQTAVYPPVESKAIRRAESFDDLYDIINEVINSKEKTNGTEILRSQQGQLVPVTNRPSREADGERHSGQPRKDDTGRRGGRTAVEGTQKQSEELLRGEHRENTGNGEARRGTGGNTTGGSRGISEPDVQRVGTMGVSTNGVGLNTEQKKRTLTEEKLPYRPHNTAFSLQSVAPAAMVEAMDRTLSQIEKKHGNIDEFVRKELGYDTTDELHQALTAEQIDSVAMAIYQMKQRQALIIGDQTGVGKGRQMAALIRWAVRQGEKPIFITQKADLFSDIYRDLVDIGSGDLVPFIFNSPSAKENKGEMVDANGKVVYNVSSTNSKQCKLCVNSSLDIDTRLLRETAVRSDCA